jgi:hypothetical protein
MYLCIASSHLVSRTKTTFDGCLETEINSAEANDNCSVVFLYSRLGYLSRPSTSPVIHGLSNNCSVKGQSSDG